MPKTHQFTENSAGTPVSIVLGHITKFERDEFSNCTSITLTGGEKIGVSESIEEVTKVIEDA